MADNQKDKFRKMSYDEIRKLNEFEAEVTLATYFNVGNNGPEAKIAVNVISSRAKDRQSTNNARTRDSKDAQFKYKIAEKLELFDNAKVKAHYTKLVMDDIELGKKDEK